MEITGPDNGSSDREWPSSPPEAIAARREINARCCAIFNGFFAVKQGFPQELLGDEKYADFIIRCGDRDFKVHKAIVCTRSPVFASAFKHGTTEGNTNIVVHEEFDAETIQRLISYIYGVPYAVSGISHNQDMLEHLRVYFAAEYYLLPGLKNAALVWIEEFCAHLVVPEGFIDILSEVYKRMNVELITKLVDFAMENAEDLSQEETFMAGILAREELHEFAMEFTRRNIKVRFSTERNNQALNEAIKILHKDLQEVKGKLAFKEIPGSPVIAATCRNTGCVSYGKHLEPSRFPGNQEFWIFKCKTCHNRWRG